jgi:hypothetical protein
MISIPSVSRASTKHASSSISSPSSPSRGKSDDGDDMCRFCDRRPSPFRSLPFRSFDGEERAFQRRGKNPLEESDRDREGDAEGVNKPVQFAISGLSARERADAEPVKTSPRVQ